MSMNGRPPSEHEQLIQAAREWTDAARKALLFAAKAVDMAEAMEPHRRVMIALSACDDIDASLDADLEHRINEVERQARRDRERRERGEEGS